MKGMYVKTAGIFAACVLMGCATPPTREELQMADYGPAPADYQATIKTFMERVLKDPESARYDFRKTPVQGFSGNPREYGWVTCVGINAKNSFGGYTGVQQYFFLIRYDSIVRTIAGDGANGIMDGIVAQSCANIGA
jgi:hypothetical protein